MINLKSIHEFIVEIYKFAKDIPIFFVNGKKYFDKIQSEDLTTNIYRLVNYVVLNILVQTFLLSETPSFDSTLFTPIRSLIFHIPLVSIGFLIALSFSETLNKIKICFNYTIFQSMITGLIPTFLLAGFVHSEVYFFYFLYAISNVVFMLFVWGKFAWLFFENTLKRIFSIVIILITIATMGLTTNYLDIHASSKLLVPLEDPIASEFFGLDCLNETQNVNSVVNSSMEKNKEIEKITDAMLAYLDDNPSIQNETGFFMDTKITQKLAYTWSLDKEKEYQRVNDKISTIERKISKARYDHTKNILYQNLETYIEYKDFLAEYDKTLILLSNIDYNTVSSIKRKGLEVSTNVVADTMKNIRSLIIANYKLDIMKRKLIMMQKSTELTEKHLSLANEVFSYLEFTKKIKQYLPIYLYNPTPLSKY